MTAAQSALLRIREEMTEKKISQRDMADELKCSQGRIAKMLNGGVKLRVDDLERLARAVNLRLSEVVRDRGLEFCAEMTPLEMRILQHVQRMQPDERAAVLKVLQIDVSAATISATPKRKIGRPMNSERVKAR